MTPWQRILLLQNCTEWYWCPLRGSNGWQTPLGNPQPEPSCVKTTPITRYLTIDILSPLFPEFFRHHKYSQGSLAFADPYSAHNLPSVGAPIIGTYKPWTNAIVCCWRWVPERRVCLQLHVYVGSCRVAMSRSSLEPEAQGPLKITAGVERALEIDLGYLLGCCSG